MPTRTDEQMVAVYRGGCVQKAGRLETACLAYVQHVGRHGYAVGWTKALGYERMHRIFYRVLVGPIREGEEVVQRCGLRNCMNVEHMELDGAVALGPQCGRGHTRSDSNGYYRPSGSYVCRMCNREDQERFRRKHAARSRKQQRESYRRREARLEEGD